MKNAIRNCCRLLLLWSVAAVSQSPQPRFQRQLVPGGSGANRISPDVGLLSGAAFSDLRDLRFNDASGKEVPYLLIPPETPEPRWIPGRILPVAPTKTTSGFEVDLGSASLVDRLRLTGIPAPFLKRFRLEGGGDRSHWTLLVAEGSFFDLPDERLRLTEAEFTPGAFRYLRVTWDDRRSGVVPEPRAAAGRLVEYRAPAATLRAGAEFRRLGAGPGRSRFQVQLPGPHLPLRAIELEVSETRLLRTARVTESRLAGAEVLQQTLGSSMLRKVAQNDLVAADLRIPIRAPEGREIEILVEDDNNPPLNLTSVQLEFSPQPWIYLESSSTAPITALYGDSRLSAPKYDLEAMRHYVKRTDLKTARWGEGVNPQPASSAAEERIPPEPGAPIDPTPFHFSRKIPASESGLTALVLDAAVLAHTRSDLADLRIADAGNRQIPYLLEKRQDDVLALDLPMFRETAAAAQSHYRVVLPFENLPPAKLVLSTTERLFQRNVSLQVKRVSTDPRSEPSMETVATAIWRHADPDTPAPPLTLDLHASLEAGSATLLVDEGDNRALAIGGARLELPLYRLRFFYPAGGKLTLLYGQEALAAPRYDLQLLAPRLVGVSSRELALEKESATAATPDGNPIQGKVFWTALVAAVVVVLGLVVRLLRSEKPV